MDGRVSESLLDTRDIGTVDNYIPENKSSAYVARHDIPSRRWSQVVFCHLLVVAQATLCGAFVAWLLVQNDWAPVHPITAFLTGTLTAGAILLSVTAFGGATYDSFAKPGPLLGTALIAAVPIAVIGRHFHLPLNALVVLAAATSLLVLLAKAAAIALCAAATRNGLLTRSVAIVGSVAMERALIARLLETRKDIVVIWSGDPGDAEMVEQLCANGQLDEIVLVGQMNDGAVVNRFSGLPVCLVRMAPDDRMVETGPAEHIHWGGPVTILSHPPLRDWGMVMKRAIDIAGALAALILFSPFMIGAAIAIRLESGSPIFFRQERFGYGSRPFMILKFRTMYVQQSDLTGSVLTARGDPRVTRVGAFLRKTSIDEMPQLFNVLRGEMSMVGPRPHPKGAKAGGVLYDELIPNFRARYIMLPGVTGLAQVNGLRGNTETRAHLIERFKMDLEYARKWSPLLDIVLLFRTFFHVFNADNAY